MAVGAMPGTPAAPDMPGMNMPAPGPPAPPIMPAGSREHGEQGTLC